MPATDAEIDRLFADLGRAQPTYCTRPTPGARHDLRQVEIIADALGTPMIPWQRLATRIISERRQDDPTAYRWRIVVITTPRQVGKTTLYRVNQVTRSVMNPGRIAFYTAQTGKDARARWKDTVSAVTADTSPFRRSVTLKLGAGEAALTFSNGSSIAPFAPTPESLHGYTPHDVAVDEAFAFSELEGDLLVDDAILPAQQTLNGRQLIIFSTAGNRDSTYLKKLLARARSSVEDPTAGIAFLEWSADPDADPYAPDTWEFHPGLDHLVTRETFAELAANYADRPRSWKRSYMNLWTDDGGREPILAPAELEQLTTYEQPPRLDPRSVSIGYEIAGDRSRMAVAAAWRDADDRVHVGIFQRTGAGADNLAVIAELTELRTAHIGGDDSGATRALNDDARAAGLDITGLTTRDFGTACESFMQLAKSGELTIHHDAALHEQLQTAVTRRLGQSTAIDREKSPTPVPELCAAIVAVRLIRTAPPPMPAPTIHF